MKSSTKGGGSGGGSCVLFGLFMGILAILSLTSTIVLAVLYSASDTQQPFLDSGANPCNGKKPIHSDAAGTNGYFNNVDCVKDNVIQALEQAGANVTKGYKGQIDASSRTPSAFASLDREAQSLRSHA